MEVQMDSDPRFVGSYSKSGSGKGIKQSQITKSIGGRGCSCTCICGANRSESELQNPASGINDSGDEELNRTFVVLFFSFLIIFSFAFYYHTANSSFNNNNNSSINKHSRDSGNTFEYLFSDLSVPEYYSLLGDTIKTQIYINTQHSKYDSNYKRPISAHISTSRNNFNSLLDYLVSLNSILVKINNNNSNSGGSNNYVFQFDENDSSNNIIKTIENNSASSNLFVFKFSGSSKGIIDFSPIEKFIDGSVSRLSRNNIYIFLSDMGQKMIERTHSTDRFEKEKMVLEESKSLLQHRFLHRIRGTVVL